MVVQGHPNTLPVTLDEMIYHAEMVGRAVQQALVVVDMPFPSYHLGVLKAIENAGRILKETRCQAVKLEGGADQADVIRGLVSAGIPVMAHCRAAAAKCAPAGRLQSAARRSDSCWTMPVRRKMPAHLRSCWSAFRRRSAAKITQVAENSHDRHRRRRELRRPGAGCQRSVGHHQRLRAEIREGVCRFESHDHRRGDAVSR